jgi:hypothetical protein
VTRTHYILDESGDPVPCDLFTWADWFESYPQARVIAKHQVGKCEVSTVFLGFDHSFFGGLPILWETMIFGGRYDGHQWRASSRVTAVKIHSLAYELALLAGRGNWLTRWLFRNRPLERRILDELDRIA